MWFVYASIILFTPHIECVGRWDVFSTNTLLQWVNSSLRHESDRIDNNINFGVSTTVCKSIHLSMMVKNGAHYPSGTQMHRIKTLHEKIVKLKDPKKFVDLDNWKLRYDMNMAGELSSRGIEEITELGNRFGKMFTPVLKQDPKNEVEILSSDDQKSINSSKYFELGLRNQIINMNIHNREINNTELNIVKQCYNFERHQQDDSNSLKQFHLFSKTPEFMAIVNSVRRKLGMSNNLAAADLYLINEWCAYGTYISNDMTWCQLLSDEDRGVLEYGQDILNFYRYSYGQSINSRMMCPLLKGIFRTMDSTINTSVNYFKASIGFEPRYPKAKIQFVGDDTLIPLMTSLGLFKDVEPLLATNMNKMHDRKFRTSQISSFGSSVAFIVYVCDNTRRLALDEFSPGQQEFRIQAFVNEKRVSFCTHRFYCLYSSTKQRYSEVIKHCNLTDVCGVNPAHEKTNNQGNISRRKNSKPDIDGDAEKVNIFPRGVTEDQTEDNTKSNNKGASFSIYYPFTCIVILYCHILM